MSQDKSVSSHGIGKLNLRSIENYLNKDTSHAEWIDLFGQMTGRDFWLIYELVIDAVPYLWGSHKQSDVRRMLIAFASKALEAAHFSDGLSDDARAALVRTANTLADLIRSLCDADMRERFDRAWNEQERYCADFGAQSVVSGVVSPRQVFASEV
jgi:hypothetical protein